MICKVSWALELNRIICRKEEGLDGKVVEDGEVSCHLSHSLMESEFLDSSLFRWNFTCKSVQIYRFRVAHWCRSLISPMRTWVQAAHGYVGSGTLVSASALYAYLFHWGITSVCSVVVVTLSLWKTFWIMVPGWQRVRGMPSDSQGWWNHSRSIGVFSANVWIIFSQINIHQYYICMTAIIEMASFGGEMVSVHMHDMVSVCLLCNIGKTETFCHTRF